MVTNGDPRALVPIAQRDVRELDANLPVFQVRTMDQIVEPSDPLTLAIVAITLAGVAVTAVAVPAVRAMRIDPVSALRAE